MKQHKEEPLNCEQTPGESRGALSEEERGKNRPGGLWESAVLGITLVFIPAPHSLSASISYLNNVILKIPSKRQNSGMGTLTDNP